MRREQTDETYLKAIKRAHDTLQGCLLGLPVSESTRGILLDQLRILYEFAIYPTVAPSASQRASSSLTRESDNASSVSGTGEPYSYESHERSEKETFHE